MIFPAAVIFALLANVTPPPEKLELPLTDMPLLAEIVPANVDVPVPVAITLPNEPVEAVIVELVAPAPPTPIATLEPPIRIEVAAPPMLSDVAVVLKTLTVEAPAIRVEEVSVVERVSLTESFPKPLAPAVLSKEKVAMPPNVLLSLN